MSCTSHDFKWLLPIHRHQFVSKVQTYTLLFIATFTTLQQWWVNGSQRGTMGHWSDGTVCVMNVKTRLLTLGTSCFYNGRSYRTRWRHGLSVSDKAMAAIVAVCGLCLWWNVFVFGCDSPCVTYHSSLWNILTGLWQLTTEVHLSQCQDYDRISRCPLLTQ